MKTTLTKVKGSAMPVCMAILLAAGVLFFSCKKNAAEVAATGNNDMARVANMVGSATEEGSMLAATDDENNVTMVFNQGSKYVLLQKIPGTPYEKADEIKSAVLITSKYGVIVKDVAANKVWLFANNDEESLQKFEAVKQQLHGSYVSTTVFGVTIVMTERS